MYRSGRRFMERLGGETDILSGIEEICMLNAVRMAVFNLVGAARSATFGVFDQKQRVYVTQKRDGFFEILNCTGNISIKEGKPIAHAKIILSDEQNRIFGGHLFSDTLLFYGELYLEEMEGSPLERQYDESSGLFLWPFDQRDILFRST